MLAASRGRTRRPLLLLMAVVTMVMVTERTVALLLACLDGDPWPGRRVCWQQEEGKEMTAVGVLALVVACCCSPVVMQRLALVRERVD